MKVSKRQSNKPKGKEPEPFGISVIAWSNDLMTHNSHFGISFEAAPWYGYPDIDPVVILPSDGCKNLGEAYNLGRQRAKYPLRIFMHQDVMLQDRSLGLKLWSLLRPGTGIGAVGPLGATVDTGGGYWFCHPKYQVGSSPDLNSMSLLLVSDARPLKVLDGIFLATNQDIEWSEEYEGTHMFIEDMCMRVRERGLSIWSVDTFLRHKGSGSGLGGEYWRSNAKFRKNWAHRFSNDVPPMELFQAFMAQYRVLGGTVGRKILEAGFYDVVWQTWAKRQADVKREERRKEREAAYV